MNISAQSFARVNVLLGEVGKSIDPKGDGGLKVSDGEAQQILKKFNELPEADKAETAKALQALMQQDVFTVSDKARGNFAKVLGIEAEKLKPAPVSNAGVRSVMRATLEALARPVTVDKKQFETLMNGLKDAPPGVGAFLMGALKSASESGDIKFDGEARPGFTREFAKREGETGAVTWMRNRFGDKFVDKMPPYAREMLSNPPYFEEILAAFMISIVNQTNEEVLREQMKIDDTLKADQKKTDQKSNEQSQRIKDSLGGSDAKKPDAGTESPAAPEAKGGRLATTKGKLEAVVSSIDARMKDGSISKDDATAIVGKLERFHDQDPVKKLLAEAIGTALQHSGLRDNPEVKPRLEPLLQWAEKVTGKSEFPPPTGLSSDKSNLARVLLDSPDVDKKLAGFLVDAFINKGSAGGPAGSTYEKFKPVLERVVSENPTSMSNEAATAATPAMLQNLERIAANREAIEKKEPGAINKAIDRIVDTSCKNLSESQRTTLKDAFKEGMAYIPKDATPAQIKEGFAKITKKIVTDTMTKTPDGKPDTSGAGAVIQDKLNKAKDAAQEKISAENDDVSKADLTRPEQVAVLEGELKAQRAALLDECKKMGFNDEQLARVGQTFDVEAKGAIKDLREKGVIEPTTPTGFGKDSTSPTDTDETRSRQLMFEKLKFKMNQLSEMMQAMSNVLNTLHTNAENAIRNIR